MGSEYLASSKLIICFPLKLFTFIIKNRQGGKMGLTMRQLKAYKKISKGSKKKYWQGRIGKLNLKIKNCNLKDRCSCR